MIILNAYLKHHKFIEKINIFKYLHAVRNDH
jgi:hypothetical protein